MNPKDPSKGGRPKGARDIKPRAKKKKQLPIPEDIAAKDLILSEEDKSVYTTIKSYLSLENRKLFEELMPEQQSPVDSLKALRDFLVARFKFYSIAEIEGLAEAKKIAKISLKELNEKGTINGRKVNANYVERKKLQLIEIINGKNKMSTSLNTLAAEIRQYNELIDRIEAGKQENIINIFNILKGKADKEATDELTRTLFGRTPELDEDDIIDVEIEEDKDNG